MKKQAILVLVIVLLATLLAAVPASAQPKNTSHLCKEWAEEPWFDLAFDSHGDCVSTLRTEPAVEYCKYVDELGYLDFYGYKNRGDCVSDRRPFPPE